MNDILIPEHLQSRPRFRGLPIPYIALIKPDGAPDFRVTDEVKRREVIKWRLCQLCAEQLGRHCFFIGGTEAAKANCYFEPACHLDCLLYAMQVCPFIAGRIEHADIAKIEKDLGKAVERVVTPAGAQVGIAIQADSQFSAVRNPYWVIKKARDWGYTQTAEGTLMLVPKVMKETKPLHAETMSAADWQRVKEALL